MLKFRFMLRKIIVMVFASFTIFSVSVSAAELDTMLERKMTPGLENMETSISEFFSSSSATDAIEQIEEDFLDSYGKMERNENNYKGLKLLPDLSYKLYTLSTEDLITAYEKTQNIGDIISKDYMVRTPIENANDEVIGTATLYEIDGKFELGAYGKVSGEQNVLSDFSQIKELISNSNLENVQDMKPFVLNKYGTYALYINTKKEEYVIPISTSSVFTELEVNKLYKADDFIKTLTLNSQEDSNNMKNDAEILYGGASILNQTAKSLKIAIVLGLFSIGVIMMVIKKVLTFKN